MSWSRSDPAWWIVCANSICFDVRFFSVFSTSSRARMSSELSGVRSSWLMFARNSLLYRDESASCSARSWSAVRASSISRFLISMRRFCSDSSCALSSSSSFVCCSSSCCDWSSSSDAFSVCACCSSSVFARFSSSCCDCSSSERFCSSVVSACDWRSSSSVRIVAWIVLMTIPIVSPSWSRKVRCTSVNGSNDASSTTAITWSSKRTGMTMTARGDASPRPETTFT